MEPGDGDEEDVSAEVEVAVETDAETQCCSEDEIAE